MATMPGKGLQFIAGTASSVGGLTIEETALLTQGNVNLAMKVVTWPNAVLEILWMW